jgi:hypothetical protein
MSFLRLTSQLLLCPIVAELQHKRGDHEQKDVAG